MYPELEINLTKLKTNLKVVADLLAEHNISLAMVTKAFCADPKVVEELLKVGVIDYLADSRIENLKGFKNLNRPKILLRIPMMSEASDVVEYADISFNSEYETIKKLDCEAAKKNILHKVVLMVDLGDLREGFFNSDELFSTVEKIIKLQNIKIVGVATNLTCYGGVLPSEENLGKLVNIAESLEERYNLEMEIISGGNSSSLHLLKSGKIPHRINNLRIGEGILLGRETAYGERIVGTFSDAFKLVCEVVENKKKVSVPIGEIGVNAFGEKPTFEDRGEMQRVIIAIGEQDIKVDAMHPVNEKIEIIGASSDHAIIDVTDSKVDFTIGDKIEFTLEYGGIMTASISKYVDKHYIF